MCGEIKDPHYHFTRDGLLWGFKLSFCYECGCKIQAYIKKLEAEG